MTISRPWYKRYPDQFIAGTMDLTLEQKGAYSMLIDLTYARNGPVPDDQKWLANILGCHWRTWRAIRKKLLEKGKLSLSQEGLITLSKVSQEVFKNGSRSVQDDLRSNDFNGLRAVEEEEEYRIRGRPPKSPKGDFGSLIHFNTSGGGRNGRRQGPVTDEFVQRLGAALDRHVKRNGSG